MTREIGYKTKPIDQAFFSKPNEFPITGEHNGHNVRAAGVQRMDGEGKPLPTAHGIHGTNTAVDWDACSADGVCMDVCPVFVYEWALNTGQSGSGKDMILAPNSPD
jgi:NAD-dependent dihydropyrimidine dehydrogenase PreA subunit